MSYPNQTLNNFNRMYALARNAAQMYSNKLSKRTKEQGKITIIVYGMNLPFYLGFGSCFNEIVIIKPNVLPYYKTDFFDVTEKYNERMNDYITLNLLIEPERFLFKIRNGHKITSLDIDITIVKRNNKVKITTLTETDVLEQVMKMECYPAVIIDVNGFNQNTDLTEEDMDEYIYVHPRVEQKKKKIKKEKTVPAIKKRMTIIKEQE